MPGPLASRSLLSLKDVTLSFGGVKALQDVSFEVITGEICSVIGPNGAGKTTLLNVINGLYRPTSGSIAFESKTYERMTPHQAAVLGIARTFQHISLFKGMTVLENIMCGRNLEVRSSFIEQALWLSRARSDELANRKKSEEIMEFLQLQAFRKTLVNALPYGVQKRVEFARALAASPRILLLDEPMAGMNLEEKLDLACHIIEVNRDFGITIVLIEHDMAVVMDISKQIVVLDYGRKIAEGEPIDVRNNTKVVEAYLGSRRDNRTKEEAA